ncbi:MAG: arginase family protein [Desulfobacterales bacterium]|nr:arginase family protein [Desulfobacterales bacterium]
MGSIAGAAKQCKKLGLLWLDCHSDANTPETSPTGNVHGMTIAISLGFGYPKFVNCAQFSPKVAPENVCIIGAKDIDKGEKKFLDDNCITYFTTFDIAKRGIVQIMDMAMDVVLKSCDAVHLSFDIDVLDPLIAPGTGIISRGEGV